MNYQELKQRRDLIVTEFHNSNLQNIEILYIEDYDRLLNFIDEYEELSRQMLQHIKKLESQDLLLGETPVTRGEEWGYVVDLEVNEERDKAWVKHFLSLGK